MSTRARVLSYGGAALLVLLGVAGGIAFGGTFGQLLAIVLIGTGLVVAMGLVFYEVGLSEDRERARERAAAERETGPRQDRARARFRLERRRGQRRRLD